MLGGAGRTALKIIAAAVLTLAILSLVMIPSQTDLLFPTNAVPPAGPLPPGAERLNLVTPDGYQLHGVHIPPSVKELGPRTLIMGFGGNAWNGQEVASYLHDIYPEAHIVAFHYRGYRPSTGSPSADALKEDAPLVFDQAFARIRPDRVVVVGFSIGSGVAASLSRHRNLDGMILVTPFDSLKEVASDLFPWLPVGPFFQHEFAVAEDISGSSVPVAILAGERDEIVYPARTAALRKEVPHLVYDRTISGAGHNDIYHHSDFHEAMHNALEAVVAGK